MSLPFQNRKDAGRQLVAEILQRHPEFAALNQGELKVLGLARGGLPVAAEVASALQAALDVIVVRKLGVPLNPEYAFGALAPNNTIYLDHNLVARLSLATNQVDSVIAEQQKELARREQLYRAGRETIRVENAIALLVDDGIATGATMRAALLYLRGLKPRRLIVAVPVAPVGIDQELVSASLADELICPETPDPFGAVGNFYEVFPQVSDDEVIGILENQT